MATSIEDLLDKIYFTAGSEAEKGSRFERLMVAYLQTAAEYADRFSEVKLWQDWEGRRGKADHGIDIVAKDLATGGWCAVQCKFYSPDHYLQRPDIDSFLAASGRQGFTSRLIVSTTDKWGKNAEDALSDQQVETQRIGLADLLQSNIDWDEVDFERPSILPTTDKKRLRPHQREALEDVIEGLGIHDRGKLIMACGTGKTFTALKIAEHVATSRKSEATSVLFLVPSIALLNQSLREWKQESEIPFRAFAVCSDAQVGRRKTSEDITTHDLVYPATTDTARLVAQMRALRDDDQFTVVFSTYQSISVVAQAQAEGLAAFDLIVCDEAHRTTGVTLDGEDESEFVRVHDNTFIGGTKRLYMTATPRLFDDSVKKKAQDADALLCSMDDEDLYGPELHRLGFGEAVSRDLLTDYKVIVLAVDEQYVAEGFQAQMAMEELPLDDTVKIVGCWNGLAKRFGPDGDHGPDGQTAVATPMRRAVAFAKDIRASQKIATAFEAVVAAHVDQVEDDSALYTEVRHVDGTQNALIRGESLDWLKAGAKESENVCRILTNVKCLSEGVDVPALDAVMFLSPRNSVVDIVQSVGRVMRKAPGKELGYIILPIGVPSGTPPEQALANHAKYKVVWQVLQALRAHDDRFNATINKLELNKARPEQIQIIGVGGGGDHDGERRDRGASSQAELPLSFDIGEWRDAIYAKIVAKCGQRRYWETWAKDIANIAQAHITRLHGILADPDSITSRRFEEFLHGLRGNLNDGITRDDAIEMLAQHLITRPVFDALFEGYEFGKHNPVAQTMQGMLDALDEHALETEQETLETFYESVRMRAAGIDNAEGRQRIIIELYDKFFATAFKKSVDKLGIVYTPVEIVDFILHSADHVLRAHFGQGLTDEGVHILDGFTGTGTFMTRLLQSGLIKPHDLARKYANELHANEILLLAYYIAAVNIETSYQDIARESVDNRAQYAPFPGLILTDTFQSWENDDRPDLSVFPENNERLERLKRLDIHVIVGNPPYSAGQENANDNNRNENYRHLDAAIEGSYVAESSASSRRTLYDSYIRAIKWASLRINDRGVIAFVTNGGFIDSNSADGMRKALAEEFSAIHILNLRGNQRTAGEQSRREGGKIFEAGSRATVAITVLVRDPGTAGPAKIYYTDIGDYLSREEKLRKVAEAASVAGLSTATVITPNEHGDWLNQRRGDFEAFMRIGEKPKNSETVFEVYSLGVASGRDAWVYGSSTQAVAGNASSMLDHYNRHVAANATGAGSQEVDRDSTRISWNDNLLRDLERGIVHSFDEGHIRTAMYRPFVRRRLYFDRAMNARVYRLPQLFPTAHTANIGFYAPNPGSSAPDFMCLMTRDLPDLGAAGISGVNIFCRWRYERVEDTEEGMLEISPLDRGTEVVEGYRRFDNISDAALRRWQLAYGTWVTKDDIFYYVYGLLHSPQYRQSYVADLRKMLPRIPLVESARPFVDAGRRLSEIHLGYESAEPYPLDGLSGEPRDHDDAAYAFFAVKKMRFGKPTPDQTEAGGREDRSTIIYSDRITLRGVPLEAYRYMLGSRSAIEWIMDRYQVKTDKGSGIVNDPNDWSREVKDPRYIVDLLARVVTVSLETMKIVDALPQLNIRPEPDSR